MNHHSKHTRNFKTNPALGYYNYGKKEHSSVLLSYTKDPQNGTLEILEETEERGSRTPKKGRSHKTKNSEQNHSTSCANFDLEILYFQNLVCPFVLKHKINTSPIVLTLKPTPEPDIARPGYAVRTEYQYKYNDYGVKSFEKAFYEHTARSAEWQDELGLNMYAMDMRLYACPVAKPYGNPAIARWVVQDPVIHFYQSPYNAYDGNPIFWADPSGADTVNIGYDREVDSDSIAGSVHWSGGLDTLGGGSENQGQNGATDPPVKGEAKKNENSEGETTRKDEQNKLTFSEDNAKYKFEAGQSYDIELVRRVLIGTPAGSIEKVDVSYKKESISTEYNYSYPGVGGSLSPKYLKASLFLKTHSSTITFYQSVSGNSLAEIFNQTDSISNVTAGAIIYYNYIEGTRNGKLFWDANQIGHGLATPLDATVISQKPTFK